MTKLLFATNNKHKIEEIQKLIGNKYDILFLKDVNITEDIPENQPTIEGNASEKSHFIYLKTKFNCFADDTGLEIEALNGEPGVFSARYAGNHKDSNANMRKVLEKMEGVSNRKARFKTVISLIIDGNEHLFEGVINGNIIESPRGKDGFGYDPIFQPIGYHETFAEMSMELKNEISHRGLATKKLIEFLKKM
ncbi:MAG TPA: non-canonical purine NTP pyrophosphatase [Bacteroidales bacterium]|nr:MAG: non-canonical purine NTP pyrophosphatase [Bacteroidetes bacterium GWF2_33_38]OFY76689.1 MAG: non-canonical purine NTP pyrophosphatase [Bacteroidetes bacterium RIFOXYA12_FULL_33_9]OFY84862.1 MAG: non-canonical purine NTP pyrophosphatase [Bacteroidetes bacterium RIFOXYA2_FULL_33_7]HBF87520.1 non-canonical purine NTP pyrophosphatase [Bacteroidales bacterium]